MTWLDQSERDENSYSRNKRHAARGSTGEQEEEGVMAAD
jgi:hypothetical protein